MTRHLLPSLLILAFAASSARAEDVSAAPPQMPTNTGGAGIQVGGPTLPAGGLNVPGTANVGTIDAAGGSMTRLPGQTATAQTTMGANTGAAQAQVSGPQGVRPAASSAANRSASANANGSSNVSASRNGPAALAAEAASAARSPAQTPNSARSRRAIDQSLTDLQKAQAQDAKTGGMSAADEVRKFFHERTGGRELADPNAAETAAAPPPGAGGSGVQGKYQQPIEAIAQQLEVAERSEQVPHDAPAQYEAALAQVAKARKEGALSTEDAESLAGIIRRAALSNAPSAMTKIAMAAEKAAARGDDQVGNDFTRAMGAPASASESAHVGSLDAWSQFLAQAGAVVAGLDGVKRELERVRDSSKAGSMERAKTSNIGFVGRDGRVEALLEGAPVPAIPGTFLSSLFSPAALKSPGLSRRTQPFEPGFSAFDGYRRLREEGVAFWPAARFVARTEARTIWEAFTGKPAPQLAPDAAEQLAAKADADYAAADANALAADYAALTGDRDAAAAVAAAEAAKLPAARRYWLERLHDLSERRRAPKPAVKTPPQATQLAAFASYFAAHKTEAVANVDSIEADASALAALKAVGTVRASGRDLWVESGVVSKGDKRRVVTLAFDAETREPVAGQIAR